MEEIIVSRAILYSFFETGSIPTQEEFADLINSYVHRREDGVFIFEPDEEIKRFGVGIPGPAYRLGVMAEGETENLISLHDLNETHKWSVNLNPEGNNNRGLNMAQETVAGSVSRLFIQEDSGNVGIGTLSPEQKLHIENSSPSSVTGIKLLNTATVENNGWTIGHVNDVETARDGGLSFQSQIEDPIERMLITPSGNVGINEPSPYTKLHVSMSNSDPQAVIGLDETTGIVNIGPITENVAMDFRGIQARTGEFTGSVLDMKTAALNLQRLGGGLLIHGDSGISEERKLTITDNGSVGIGTLNPSEKIDVNGGIKIGNTDGVSEGTIRWTGTDFEGYDGSIWKSLTGKESYLKGGSYILVKALGTPLENGADLLEAIAIGNELSYKLNLKTLALEEVQPGWYVIFGNEEDSYGGTIQSISANEMVLSGAGDFASLPFTIQKLQFFVDKRTRYQIDFQVDCPVIESVTYNPADGSAICTLSVPFPEHFQYQANSADAVRIQVIAAPGQYLLSQPAVLSNDYVDLVSLTGNPDVELDLTDDHFYTGEVDFTSFGGGIIEVINDPFIIINMEQQRLNVNPALLIEASCFVKGIKTKMHYSPTFKEATQIMFEDVDMEPYSTDAYPLPIDVKPTDDYVRIAPTVENCRGGHYSFGINLAQDSYLVIDGIYLNNEAWYGSFGYRCDIWGSYKNNKGRVGSFAALGAASGRFIDNTGGDFCFGGGGGEAGGEFINCRSGMRSFGENAGGTFTGCVAGDLSFGRESAGGQFINCHSGEESFGRHTADGTFTGCTGGQASFGGGEKGFLRGMLYYCRLTSGTFRTVSDSGRTVYCIDGNNEHNNQ